MQQLKTWARQLKQELFALQLAFRSPAVPWYAKGLIFLTLAYAFSPIDLIPDFIPVLGLLDDLILLPGFIYLAVKLIPDETLAHCRAEAARQVHKKQVNWLGGIIILSIWAALAYLGWQYYAQLS